MSKELTDKFAEAFIKYINMDWEAYKLGQKHCKKVDGEMRGYENPYDEGTESFISYRKGWNEYWEESWGRQRRAKAESLIK